MENVLNCFAVSDLHGKADLYEKLFHLIEKDKPEAVFIAGDLTGGYFRTRLGEDLEDFFLNFISSKLTDLKAKLGNNYPEIFVILGNDDPAYLSNVCRELDDQGLWNYMHNRCLSWKGWTICGYSIIPPTPFQLKDWEKYDVSRFVDVGAIAPDCGFRTCPADPLELEWGTIKRDLEKLFTETNLDQYIGLFHSPPYKTKLDRAALDGKMIDHAPLDVHIGSIAIRELIEKRQPHLTIHGHVHESSDITGCWEDRIGSTIMLNPACHLQKLSVIHFNLSNPSGNLRKLY